MEESYRPQVPFRRNSCFNYCSCKNRIKSTIVGNSTSNYDHHRATLSPCSVLNPPHEPRHYHTPFCRFVDHRSHSSNSCLSLIGAKRKFPFDNSSIFPTCPPYIPSPPSSSNSIGSSNRSTCVNLRHRLICEEMVQWLSMTPSDLHPPLSELWLGPVFESSETVLNAIATVPHTVQHLDLDLRNALHLVPLVMPLLLSKQHLTSLSVRVFGDTGAIDIAKSLHRNPNLQRLDLRGNRIGSLGTKAIVDALLACDYQNVLRLNLSSNCILHSNFLGHLLASSTTHLQSLDLAFNWLGDEDVADICQGLSKNKTLRELSLYGCRRITNRGLNTILDCIKVYNTSMHKIHLQAFDDEGCKIVHEIDHWLTLNQAGRYLLQTNRPVPQSLWPLVLEQSQNDPDAIFYFLREAIAAAKVTQGDPK